MLRRSFTLMIKFPCKLYFVWNLSTAFSVRSPKTPVSWPIEPSPVLVTTVSGSEFKTRWRYLISSGWYLTVSCIRPGPYSLPEISAPTMPLFEPAVVLEAPDSSAIIPKAKDSGNVVEGLELLNSSDIYGGQ